MTVHVVIPVHDHIEETLRCLRCLRAQTYANWRAIVIDDGSTDGTSDILAREMPEVEVIQGNGRLWWTGATALGIERALKGSAAGDLILLINNDTTFGPDYLEQLIATSDKHGRAVTGSLNVDRADPSRVIDAGVWWDWPAVQSRRLPRRPGVDDTTCINTISGRGMLVPVEVFEAVGSVDAARLPHYTADYELACRARRAGFPLALSYRAEVQVDGATTGLEGDLATPRTVFEVVELLLSNRSRRNLRHRLRFISLACPPRYRIRNYLAIFVAAGLLMSNVPALFQCKNALFRLLPRRARAWLIGRKMMVSSRDPKTN